jgi:hypothetical protein
MKKTTAIIIVGMFVIVGCGSAVMGEPDDPVRINRPPNAPVFVMEKSDWEKESYTYVFYAEDPDGDQVYYDIAWEKVSDTERVSSPDDPVVLWLGPFNSSEEVQKTHTFDKHGEYELTIRAKDTHDSIGPATTITVTYKSSITQLLILSKLMERHPAFLKILAMIF